MKKPLFFWNLVQYEINKELERANDRCRGVVNRALERDVQPSGVC